VRRLSGEGIALPATLALYYGRVLPATRRELGRRRREAAHIPDPELRRAALRALEEKGSNVEAVAVFATLAPRRSRAAVLRAIVSLQVAIDYLDELDEAAGAELRNGLTLHRALADALEPGGGRGDWYARHPRQEDAGYLAGLVEACRAAVSRLPARDPVLPAARRAAQRCGEGQSHTHAAAAGAREGLRAWAAELPAPDGFEWWETAAGASSSVAAHALIALAGAPGGSAAEAELFDAAYFPAIGALTVLLDDLVDAEADAAAGEHSYLRYYASSEAAAARIGVIAALARDSLRPLRRAGRQRAILAGVLGYYLSQPGSRGPFALPVRERVLATGGPTVRLLTRLLQGIR